MTRAAPSEIPDDAQRFGNDRYVVFESLGHLAQGMLYAVWDGRLRMWRIGLMCEPATQAAVQNTARTAEDIRQPGLLRTRDVVDGWVVLEAVEAQPLEIRTAWPAGAARDAVCSVGRAALALRDAGLDPGPIGPEHVLATEEHGLLLVPPACAAVHDDDAPATAKALSLLMAGLVRGLPMDSAYDDASALPPALAAAHGRATGHRPVLTELVRALESYDAYAEESTDALRADADPPLSRAEQIAAGVDTDQPTYFADNEQVRAQRERRLEETRRKAEEAATAAEIATKVEAEASSQRGRFVAVMAVVIAVVLSLAVIPPAGLLGYGTTSVRGARSASLAAEQALAETLELEVGARDELERLGIDVEPIRLAHVAGPYHETRALALALESTQTPPMADTPEARVLRQRWERIQPQYDEAAAQRAAWKGASEGLAGGLAVALALAPPFEPIPSIDPIE